MRLRRRLAARDTTASTGEVGHEHHRGLVDAFPDAVVVVDRQLRCVDLNDAAVRLDGRRRSTILGTPFHNLGPLGSVDGERLVGIREVLEGRRATTLEYGTVVDDVMRWYELRSIEGPSVADEPTVLVITRDITEQHVATRLLVHRATHDPLTGLMNRRGLIDTLEPLIERDPPARFAVLQIDVDGLKRVNDADGHAAGDELLIGVARQLQSVLREVMRSRDSAATSSSSSRVASTTRPAPKTSPVGSAPRCDGSRRAMGGLHP